MKKKLLAVILLLFGTLLIAGALPATLAFLSIDNISMDPRYDYLEGIIRGILLFDLSGQESQPGGSPRKIYELRHLRHPRG